MQCFPLPHCNSLNKLLKCVHCQYSNQTMHLLLSPIGIFVKRQSNIILYLRLHLESRAFRINSQIITHNHTKYTTLMFKFQINSSNLTNSINLKREPSNIDGTIRKSYLTLFLCTYFHDLSEFYLDISLSNSVLTGIREMGQLRQEVGNLI